MLCASSTNNLSQLIGKQSFVRRNKNITNQPNCQWRNRCFSLPFKFSRPNSLYFKKCSKRHHALQDLCSCSNELSNPFRMGSCFFSAADFLLFNSMVSFSLLLANLLWCLHDLFQTIFLVELVFFVMVNWNTFVKCALDLLGSYVTTLAFSI